MITDIYLRDLVARLNERALLLRDSHGVTSALLEEAARTISHMDDGLEKLDNFVAMVTDY